MRVYARIYPKKISLTLALSHRERGFGGAIDHGVEIRSSHLKKFALAG